MDRHSINIDNEKRRQSILNVAKLAGIETALSHAQRLYDGFQDSHGGLAELGGTRLGFKIGKKTAIRPRSGKNAVTYRHI